MSVSILLKFLIVEDISDEKDVEDISMAKRYTGRASAFSTVTHLQLYERSFFYRVKVKRWCACVHVCVHACVDNHDDLV